MLHVAAAAIRQASSSASPSQKDSSVCKPKLKFSTVNDDRTVPEEGAPKKARNRSDLLYSKDEEEPNQKIDKIIEEKNKEIAQKKEEQLKKKKNDSGSGGTSKAKQSGDSTPTIKRKDEPSTSSVKRKSKTKNVSPNKKIKPQKPMKPFNELLNGVNLVISGIQNPDRGNLRGMALSMGAKYKADWDNSCTHLM